MINFRYHIVSLMAVFLALAVGIATGVSLGTPVDKGLLQQAAQDRKQVTDLRAELDRRNAVDNYREAYDQRIAQLVTAGQLSGQRVAMISMPDAPGGVEQAIETEVEQAGGAVVRRVRMNVDAYDPAKAADVETALQPFSQKLGLNGTEPQGRRVGMAVARSVLDAQGGDRDDQALAIGKAMSGSGMANISNGPAGQAQLAIVVTAQATDPPPTTDLLVAHVEFDLGLKSRGAGVVLAGPNSAGLDGTDVQTARTQSDSANVLSTVDVADLTSGVTTTVLAGKEQLQGHQGHYGASGDAPLPTLPVR